MGIKVCQVDIDILRDDIAMQNNAFRNVPYMQKSVTALFLEKLYSINKEAYVKTVSLVHKDRVKVINQGI